MSKGLGNFLFLYHSLVLTNCVQLQFYPGPLHKACQKGTKFVWSEECGKSFEALKQELVSPPILIYPVPGKQFILDTDASNFAVGAVLSIP
jgi:hypothetical protein